MGPWMAWVWPCSVAQRTNPRARCRVPVPPGKPLVNVPLGAGREARLVVPQPFDKVDRDADVVTAIISSPHDARILHQSVAERK